MVAVVAAQTHNTNIFYPTCLKENQKSHGRDEQNRYCIEVQGEGPEPFLIYL